MGILSREGADFGGYWRIILSYHFEGMRRSTLRLYNWRQNWAKKVSSLALEVRYWSLKIK